MVADVLPDWQVKVHANLRVAARSNARLGNRKTKTGCLTCRKRRVKCDESMPLCQRCKDTSRECEGYTSGSSTSSQGTTPSPSSFVQHAPSSALVTGSDGQVLQYFQTWAVQRIVGQMDLDFWSRTIMQLCHTERWALKGALAISSLYRQYSDPSIEDQHSYHSTQALRYYNQSLASARKELEKGQLSPVQALTSCIIFICFETLRDNANEAVALFLQGLRILENLPKATMSQTAVTRIRGTFVRLVVLVATFGWPRVKEVRLQIEQENSADSFATSAEARSALFAIVSQVRADPRIFLSEKWRDSALALGWLRMHDHDLRAIGDPAEYRQVLAGQQFYIAKLGHWRTALQSSPPRDCGTETQDLIQLHYYVTKIFLHLLHQHLQSAFDAHVPDFLEALRHATTYVNAKAIENTTMTFELGAIPMLYAIAFRCRVPSIRRRALAVLRRAPKRECTYDSALSGALAERVVAFEEEGLGLPEPGVFREDVPLPDGFDDVVIGEERRVHMVWSVADHLGRWGLRVSRFRPDDTGRWRLVEEELKVTGILRGVEVERGLYPFYPVRKPPKAL